MNTAFAATVGKGDLADIRPALVKSISEANPSFLLLFATAETKTNADDICQTLNRNKFNSRVHVLVQPKEDVENLYLEMLDAVTEMMDKQGIKPSDVTVDFTTGMKTMSAALVLAAVKLGLGRLKYIVAKRDDQHRICPGGERTLTFFPAGLQASLLLDSATELMRHYRFDAVKRLLEPVSDRLLSESDRTTRSCLLNLASAYLHWDLFCHIRFKAAYDNARLAGDKRMLDFKARDETVSAVMQLGQDLQSGKLTDLGVVDLINNARRRIEEGKYDDATARLYRACEMLAQWRLQSRHAIDTGKVDLSKVPQASKQWLEHCRGGPQNEVQIGLHKSYQLLKEMDDELGKAFFTDETLRGLLRERNHSVLGHGTKPVKKDACEKLLNSVEALVRNVVPDYDDKTTLLRFPWSR